MEEELIYREVASVIDWEELESRILALTGEKVGSMSYQELEDIFPKYKSGEFRILQNGRIWDKLEELVRDMPQDSVEYHEKRRILNGIRLDGMMA